MGDANTLVIISNLSLVLMLITKVVYELLRDRRNGKSERSSGNPHNGVSAAVILERLATIQRDVLAGNDRIAKHLHHHGNSLQRVEGSLSRVIELLEDE